SSSAPPARAMSSTLPEFLLHWAERTPNAIFVGEPDRGGVHTYGDVARRVARARALFRRIAIARGDRGAVLGDNSVRWVVAYLSAIAPGAVAGPRKSRPC